MYTILVVSIIGFVVVMLFVNIYFRVKVMKHYKILVQNKVEFPAKYILNKKKIEEEVLPKYPKFEKDILAFCNNIQNSVQMASVLIALITLFGAVLMYYR